jgi:hypothetical protein
MPVTKVYTVTLVTEYEVRAEDHGSAAKFVGDRARAVVQADKGPDAPHVTSARVTDIHVSG